MKTIITQDRADSPYGYPQANEQGYLTSSKVSGPFGNNSVVSASYALTASYALNAGGGGTTIDSSSFVTTSSFNAFTASYNTGSFSGSFTGSLFGTASWAESASVALYALSSPFQPTPPGGNSREIQFNENNTFGARSTFIFNYDVTESLQQGNNVQASGQYSHAEGSGSITYGNSSHAEGAGTIAGWLGYLGVQKNSPIISLNQIYGDLTTTFTPGTIILFDDTQNNNIYGTIKAVVSESIFTANTEITLTDSTINTNNVCVIGIYGNPIPTLADTPGGNHSHAEGSGSQTYGVGSHTSGLGTIAIGNYQKVQGQYNVPTNGQSAFIIGNGTDDTNRSNLLFASGSQIQVSGSLFVTKSVYLSGLTSASQSNIVTIDTSTGQLYYTASSAVGGGGGGTPGGPNTSIQFNNNGTFSGSANLTFNSASNALTLTGSLLVSQSHISTVDYIDFNTSSLFTSTTGRVNWIDQDGTLELGLKGGVVKSLLGQGLVTRVVNKTNPLVDLLGANYQVVVVSGAQGQRLAVKLAQADNDANSAGTLGLVAENIARNQEGFVVTVGLLKNINTTGNLQGETWTDGDILYLSPTTAGQITNIKPQAPQHTVIVGYVEYAHQNNGKIYVKIDNGYEIDELHNVRIVSDTTGDLLVKSGSLWINSKILTGSYTLSGSLTTNDGVSVQTLTASFISASSGITGSLFGTATTASYVLASSIAGDLSRIASGSVTASVTPSQFSVASGSTTELVVTGTGVTIGSAATDTHSVTGSLGIQGLTSQTPLQVLSGSTSLLFVSRSGNIGITNNTPTSKLHIVTNAIGTTLTDAQGILLENTTTGVVNISQTSPSIVLSSNGYGSTAGTSQNAKWRLASQADGNTTSVVGNLIFQISKDGGGYSNVFTLTNDRFGGNTLTIAGNITAAGSTLTGNFLTLNPLNTTAGFSYLSITSGHTGFSGTPSSISVGGTFGAGSGGQSPSGISITPAISQTGTASGSIRLLYLNPSISSVGVSGSFRAIESTTGSVVLADSFAASGSRSGSLLDLSQTWNTAGNVTAIRLNVTEVGSGASSNLLDLQTAGISRFAVSKGGAITTEGNIISTNGSISVNRAVRGGGSSTVYTNTVSFVSDGTYPRFSVQASDNWMYYAGETYNPTSGSGTYTSFRSSPTITQTGTANGITRGLFINPTLQSAANFRAIDINSGSLVMADSYLASGSRSGSLLDLSQTWNSSGSAGLGTVTGIRYNVTNISSSAASTILDLQQNSTSIFNVVASTSRVNISRLGGSPGIRISDTTGGSTNRWMDLQVSSNSAVISLGSAITGNPNFYISNQGGFAALSLSNGTDANTFFRIGTNGQNPAGSGPAPGIQGSAFAHTYAGTDSVNFTHMHLVPTVSQSAAATGISRGLYINPVLTSAFDYRAIQINSGSLVMTDSYLASGSRSGSLLDLTQTWNTAGNVTGFRLNIVTPTSAGASSRIFDIQRDGVSFFRMNRDGSISTEQITFGTNGNTGYQGSTYAAGGGFVNAVVGYTTTNSSTPTTAGTISIGYSAGNTFAPTTGTAEYVAFRAAPIISQSAATGITRGLHIIPTLQAAADFRAIEATSGSIVLPYTSQTATYTIRTSDYLVDITGSTSAITASLPTAVGCRGRTYIIKNTNSNSVSLAASSSQTIDGSSTYNLSSQYKYVQVVSDGANWIITGNN